MDICETVETQFYILRDRNEAVAIIELPIMACLRKGESVSLEGLIGYQLGATHCFADWIGFVGDRKMDLSFHWREKQCCREATPTSMTALVSDSDGLDLEPTNPHEAENALLLADLDYFRATTAYKLMNSPFKLEVEYVGKLEVGGTWPRLHEYGEDGPEKTKLLPLLATPTN